MNRSTQRWRPSPVGDFKTDQSFRSLFDQLYGLVDACLLPPAANTAQLRMAAGVALVTGSEKQIVTGLVTVLYLVATLQSASALNEWVTGEVLTAPSGNISLYCWKPTGAGDTTPIASTTERTVHWMVWGTD